MFLRVNNSYPTNLLETILEENEKYYKFKEEIIYLEHNKILLKENFYEEELLENVVSSLWEHLKNFVLKILKFLAYPFIAFKNKVYEIIDKKRKKFVDEMAQDITVIVEANIIEGYEKVIQHFKDSIHNKKEDFKQSIKDKFNNITTSIRNISNKEVINNVNKISDTVIPELFKEVDILKQKLYVLKSRVDKQDEDPDELNKEISHTANMITKLKSLISKLTSNVNQNLNKL
jgi:hypothetical protein